MWLTRYSSGVFLQKDHMTSAWLHHHSHSIQFSFPHLVLLCPINSQRQFLYSPMAFIAYRGESHITSPFLFNMNSESLWKSSYGTFKWGLWTECYNLFNGNTDLLQPDPGSGPERMALKGKEWTSSNLLDWVEPEGKAAIVILISLSFLRSTSDQKIITDMQ